MKKVLINKKDYSEKSKSITDEVVPFSSLCPISQGITLEYLDV
jgi:hypothetical protein